MKASNTLDLASKHRNVLGQHGLSIGHVPSFRIQNVKPIKNFYLSFSSRRPPRPTAMTITGSETITAESSVPEILQTRGRTLRVNYIRRDEDYEVRWANRIRRDAVSLESVPHAACHCH